MEIKSHIDFFGNFKEENDQKKYITEQNKNNLNYNIENNIGNDNYIIIGNQKKQIEILEANNKELKMRLYFSAVIIVMLSFTIFKILH